MFKEGMPNGVVEWKQAKMLQICLGSIPSAPTS